MPKIEIQLKLNARMLARRTPGNLFWGFNKLGYGFLGFGVLGVHRKMVGFP